MARRLFFNSRGKGRTLAELDAEMNRGGETTRMGNKTLRESEKRHSPRHRSRSPKKEKQQRGNSPRSRGETSATPRPLSFSIFVGNKPMTEADSIIRDPNVAIEFARQIFSPEVQQSMVSRADYKVFREGVHGAVKGLYTSYEIGMHLRAARKDIEQRNACFQSLQAHMEKAENEMKKASTFETYSTSQVNPIVAERVHRRIMDHAIADRETANMFAIEFAKARSYEKGFHDG